MMYKDYKVLMEIAGDTAKGELCSSLDCATAFFPFDVHPAVTWV